MGSYYDNYVKLYQKQTEDDIKKRQDKNTATSNQYVADINAIVDTNIANSVNKVQAEIDKTPTQYQSALDANAIQQKINERQVAERMANMGLTNSGLNRTQQTAINIQRSNADAAVRQQINSVTASLKQQIADLYASGESQKAENAAKERYNLEQKNQAVYEAGMDALYSNASAYEKAQIESAAKVEEARIKAEEKAREKYLDWALENGYVYDANGNLVNTGTTTNASLKAPTQNQYDHILNEYIMLGGFEDSDKFFDWLDRQYPKSVYDQNAIVDYLEQIRMTDNGGKNYGGFLGLGYGGIDENGEISYGNGTEITMQELYNRLKKIYGKDKAEDMVIKFQHKMGI